MGRGPRPPAGVHLDRPGLRRLEVLVPRGRSGPADPGLRPDQARGRVARAGDPPRPGRPAQPAVRPDPPAAPGSSTWRSTPCAAASRGRSSRTNSARRSITGRPPTSSSGSSSPTRSGIVHVGGRERLSRFELMRRAARLGHRSRPRPPRIARPTPTCPNPGPPTSRSTRPGWPRLFPALERPSVEAALADRPLTLRSDPTRSASPNRARPAEPSASRPTSSSPIRAGHRTLQSLSLRDRPSARSGLSRHHRYSPSRYKGLET